MVEERYNEQIFSQLQKPEILKKAVVVIMLDFTNPWGFMEELDNWIGFLYELQKRAGLSIVDLEEMAANSNKKNIHSHKLLQEIQRTRVRLERKAQVRP